MYSLSTCWNSARHTDGRAMLREIRELGFEYAELSHGIRLSLVPGILDALKAGEMKISTLHNFCPLPVGVNGAAPNLFEFSSDRDRDRQLAFKHTVVTLDFAVRVGAPLVVLHFGRMDLKNYTGKLKELIQGSDTVGVVHVCEAWMRFGGNKDHVMKQIALGEMRISDLKPEDRGAALFVAMQETRLSECQFPCP